MSMIAKYDGSKDDRKISELTVGELREIIRETISVSLPYQPYPMCPQPFYYKPSPNPWDETYKVFCTDHTDIKGDKDGQ